MIKSKSLWFVVLAVVLSAGCGEERSVNLTGLWVPDGEIARVEDPPLVREPTTGDGPPDADGMGREPTLLDGETVALQYQLSHVGNTATVTLYVDGYEGWGQARYTQYAPEYTEWFSDDGLIISPIVAFVELVWQDPALHPAFKWRADEYLRVS